MVGPVRTVHDTNVVRNVILRSNPESHWLFQAWLHQIVLPIVNQRTVAELIDHFVKRGPPHIGEAIRRADATIEPYLQFAMELPYQAAPQAPHRRDQNDQKFLELAYTSGAEYLVTEDNALLDLDADVHFTILRATDFRQTLADLLPNT